MDVSRFILTSDSRCINIWKKKITCNHPSNLIERDFLEVPKFLFGTVSCLETLQNSTSFKEVQLLGSAIVRRFSCLMCICLEVLWFQTSSSWTTKLHLIVYRCHRAFGKWRYSTYKLAWKIPGSKSHRTCVGPFWEMLGSTWQVPTTIPKLKLALQEDWDSISQ